MVLTARLVSGGKNYALRKDSERRGLVGRQRQARQSCERRLEAVPS